MTNLKLAMAISLVAALAACGSQTKKATGGVQVSVGRAALSTSVAPPAKDIARVTLVGVCTNQAERNGCSELRLEFPTPVAFPLILTVPDLKTGWAYTFTATAIDGSGAPLFEGSSELFTVVEDVVAALHIVMQQIPAPGTVAVKAPFISSIGVSNASPSVGQEVKLTAKVKDVDGSETFAWSSSCSNAAAPSTPDVFTDAQPVLDATGTFKTQFTSWCVGTETLTFSVTTQASQATLGKSLVSTVQFTLRYDAQGFAADIGFNAWPDIQGVGVIGNAQPQPGETIQLDVMATDADGDDLVYTWVVNCGEGDGGAGLSSQFEKSPTFTAPSAPAQCEFYVCVSDYKGKNADGSEILRGGYNQATLVLNIGTKGLPLPADLIP